MSGATQAPLFGGTHVRIGISDLGASIKGPAQASLARRLLEDGGLPACYRPCAHFHASGEGKGLGREPSSRLTQMATSSDGSVWHVKLDPACTEGEEGPRFGNKPWATAPSW